MSTVIQAVEGITRGLLGYFFDAKEEAYELPPINTSPLELKDIFASLTNVFSEDKRIGFKYIDGGQTLAVTCKEQLKVIAGICEHRAKEPTNPFAKHHSSSWDELHRRNRTLLWETEQQLENGSSPALRKPFRDLLHVVDALVATGRTRIYQLNIMSFNGLISASIMMVGGTPAKPEFFDIVTVVENITYNFKIPNRGKETELLYATKHDAFGRTTMVRAFNAANPEVIDMEVFVKYHDTKPTYRFSEDWTPDQTIIPASIVKATQIVSIHGVSNAIDPVTGRTFVSYNCVTKHNNACEVTIVY